MENSNRKKTTLILNKALKARTSVGCLFIVDFCGKAFFSPFDYKTILNRQYRNMYLVRRMEGGRNEPRLTFKYHINWYLYTLFSN